MPCREFPRQRICNRHLEKWESFDKLTRVIG